MAEYSMAIDYFVDQSRVFANQNTHSAIVVHCTGGVADQTAQQLGDYFRSNSLMTSVHYGIDRPGVICQYVREQDGAAGNCCLEAGHDPYWDQFGGDNLNIHTISIECVNDATNSLTLTDAQEQALFKLITYLCQKYSLSADQIKTHASIAPIDRARCPGDAYPLQGLKDYVQQQNQGGNTDMAMLNLTDPVVQTFFTDGGNGAWKCKKNGVILFGGNLGFYRENNGLTLFGLPLSNEIYLPQYPGTAIVICERVLQVWDPGKIIDNPPNSGPCYLLHIDGGIGQQLLLQSAQTTLAGELATANSKLDKIKQIVN